MILEWNPTQPIDPDTFSMILNSVLNLNQNKYLHQVEAFGLIQSLTTNGIRKLVSSLIYDEDNYTKLQEFNTEVINVAITRLKSLPIDLLILNQTV
jgi:hypothetical protein